MDDCVLDISFLSSNHIHLAFRAGMLLRFLENWRCDIMVLPVIGL